MHIDKMTFYFLLVYLSPNENLKNENITRVFKNMIVLPYFSFSYQYWIKEYSRIQFHIVLDQLKHFKVPIQLCLLSCGSVGFFSIFQNMYYGVSLLCHIISSITMRCHGK